MTEPGERSTHTLLLDIYQRLASVEAQNDQIMRSQGDAAESRKAIHAKLEDFGLIAATVRRLEPIVAELDRIRERAIGAQFVMKIFWAVFGLVSATAGMIGHYFLYGNRP